MYVVTFYSFKGGGGRSMALVNVGAQLAQMGKRVLLVDFDLEAPGLPSFDLKKSEKETKGVVDYVYDYLESGHAPEIGDFVYESNQFPTGGQLLVMPVGLQDDKYSHRLNSINWQELYSVNDGYLLFENLKKQWERDLQIDYVLIDSRTGHSDVEGICTRQLPNAVCLVFLPNEQNLCGLKRIVAAIRAEHVKTYDKSISMHFVVSNVPDLDDEDRILGQTLRRFRDELGYERLSAQIHHYNSFSLLKEEVFSITRPNSRLTREYRKLVTAISQENLADRDAVVGLLKSTNILRFEAGEFFFTPAEIVGKLPEILTNFSGDAEINYLSARIYEHLGKSGEALALLTGDVVEKAYRTSAMFSVRAILRNRVGQKDEAIVDIRNMLAAEGSSIDSLLSATSVIDQLAPELYSELPTSKALVSLPLKEQLDVGVGLDENKHQLLAKLEILRRLANSGKDEAVVARAMDELPVTAIALGNFGLAIEVLNQADTPSYMNIQTAFNLAMALWGRDGHPQKAYFQKVIDLDDETSYAKSTPNYLQCLGLTHAIMSNRDKARFLLTEAKRRAERRAGRHFSSWTYSRVETKVFIEHLRAIESLLGAQPSTPAFIAQAKVEEVGSI